MDVYTSAVNPFPSRVAGTLLCAALAGIASCGPKPPASIVLFRGKGTSPNDVAALESILRSHHLAYVLADSSQLDAMSVGELRAYRLLIVPGGNFEAMGRGLAPATAGNVRRAVTGGLHYLGICAGAFLAGNVRHGGFNLTNGVAFPFYGAEARGIRKAAVWVQSAGEPALQHYWEDGPALTGWGDVVGRYPDGTPAIVEARVGDGRVILSGVHPEAPERWRGGMTFTTPAAVDQAYAAKLIEAALRQTPLAHF